MHSLPGLVPQLRVGLGWWEPGGLSLSAPMALVGPDGPPVAPGSDLSADSLWRWRGSLDTAGPAFHPPLTSSGACPGHVANSYGMKRPVVPLSLLGTNVPSLFSMFLSGRDSHTCLPPRESERLNLPKASMPSVRTCLVSAQGRGLELSEQ